jgi:hypothetical protein
MKFQIEKEAFEEAEKERRAREEEVMNLKFKCFCNFVTWHYSFTDQFLSEYSVIEHVIGWLCRTLKEQERKVNGGGMRGIVGTEIEGATEG